MCLSVLLQLKIPYCLLLLSAWPNSSYWNPSAMFHILIKGDILWYLSLSFYRRALDTIHYLFSYTISSYSDFIILFIDTWMSALSGDDLEPFYKLSEYTAFSLLTFISNPVEFFFFLIKFSVFYTPDLIKMTGADSIGFVINVQTFSSNGIKEYWISEFEILAS